MKSFEQHILNVTLAGALAALIATPVLASPAMPDIKSSASNDRVKAGEYMDDVWITTKVRSLLLKEEGVQGLGVNVETHQGTVQLSGWVSTPSQIAQAEKIALAVEGVRGIRNDLQIKR